MGSFIFLLVVGVVVVVVAWATVQRSKPKSSASPIPYTYPSDYVFRYPGDIELTLKLLGDRNPVHERSGLWYFWDETWKQECGPFNTYSEAGRACAHRCESRYKPS
ncbi:MAG: hypothetical protein AAB345_01820 [Patescibacteria group bacterium]